MSIAYTPGARSSISVSWRLSMPVDICFSSYTPNQAWVRLKISAKLLCSIWAEWRFFFFFFLLYSSLVLLLFEFLYSSWKWMRLPEWNNSKQYLMTLSHWSIIKAKTKQKNHLSISLHQKCHCIMYYQEIYEISWFLAGSHFKSKNSFIRAGDTWNIIQAQ